MQLVQQEIIEHELEKIKRDINIARDRVQRIGLSPGNNVLLLCYAIEATKNLPGVFLECGVYVGNTLFTADEFKRVRGINRVMCGADTFDGFDCNPDGLPNVNDTFAGFDKLLSEKKITQLHYDLAKERTNKHVYQEHLSKSYFASVADSVFEESKIRGIRLYKGAFSEALKNFEHDIAVLHIDCDLYEAYKDCFSLLFHKVVKGGIIVLDEYYSRKYPGARIATDEFLNKLDPASYNMIKYVVDGFERWAIVKL